MVSNDLDANEPHWIETETPDDWVSTRHEQVYFRDPSPRRMHVSTTALVMAGAGVSKALPGDWTTVITAGPYRGHDVEYLANYEAKRIHLDFYSPRPGFHYLTDVIDDVKQGMDDSSDGQLEVGA